MFRITWYCSFYSFIFSLKLFLCILVFQHIFSCILFVHFFLFMIFLKLFILTIPLLDLFFFLWVFDFLSLKRWRSIKRLFLGDKIRNVDIIFNWHFWHFIFFLFFLWRFYFLLYDRPLIDSWFIVRIHLDFFNIWCLRLILFLLFDLILMSFSIERWEKSFEHPFILIHKVRHIGSLFFTQSIILLYSQVNRILCCFDFHWIKYWFD